ncbi:helix-turn-helix transcriptional regulator [Chenggangzhangella methanolivorans]|uniref:Helix-turn-helix domain-containing protein n=1 Tax=Chenggangzhangella methanolivorans TaxID=1437009 RepID=A0A9E6UNH5_9HYPH|nr:helix-turn-helix domain-containing protein [Chenggangzhangella methanolivorans]QZN98534.1 helix-turn-helix domain-containing protein [Chenggangzhangella methanolivorans]
MQSLTIEDWCKRHGLCRSTFYNLQKAGKGPRLMKVGAVTRISETADREWVAEREAEAITSRQEAA